MCVTVTWKRNVLIDLWTTHPRHLHGENQTFTNYSVWTFKFWIQFHAIHPSSFDFVVLQVFGCIWIVACQDIFNCCWQSCEHFLERSDEFCVKWQKYTPWKVQGLNIFLENLVTRFSFLVNNFTRSYLYCDFLSAKTHIGFKHAVFVFTIVK